MMRFATTESRHIFVWSDPFQMTRGLFGPNQRRENGENSFVIDCVEGEFLKFRLTAQRRRHGCEPYRSSSSKSRIGWNVRWKVNAFSLSKKGTTRSAPAAFAIQADADAERYTRTLVKISQTSKKSRRLPFIFDTSRNSRVLYSKWMKASLRMALIEYELY